MQNFVKSTYSLLFRLVKGQWICDHGKFTFKGNFQHFTVSRFTSVQCCEFLFTPNSRNFSKFKLNHDKFFTQNHVHVNFTEKFWSLAIFFHTVVQCRMILVKFLGVCGKNDSLKKNILYNKSYIFSNSNVEFNLGSLVEESQNVHNTQRAQRALFFFSRLCSVISLIVEVSTNVL